MSPQWWQAVAAFAAACAALYTVVTLPLLRVIKAEIGLSEERTKGLITGLKAEMAAMEARLNARIDAMEKRLNERIDTWLIHR